MKPLHLLTSSDTSESAYIFAANSEIGPLHQIKTKCPDIILPLDLNQQTPSTDSVQYDIEDRRMSTVSTCSDFSIGIFDLLNRISEVDEDCTLAEHGYTKVHKLSNTLQGDLWKAEDINTGKYVAIKRTEKSLLKQGIAIDPEDNMSICVSENIIKEAIILKHLTVDNHCIGNHIVEYIEMFESDTDYYLVMEYIQSEMNLKQFIAKANEYKNDNKLKLKHYQKIMKYLYWQLIVTINWMHNDMNCVHLDIVTDNIMVKNAEFTLGSDGYYTINSNIQIKLTDFGVSEIYELNNNNNNNFSCIKYGLSLDNEAYVSPEIYNHTQYDCRLSDAWSLGIVLYECMVGKILYEPMEMWQKPSKCSGYWSLKNGLLKQWLFTNKMDKYFTNDSLQLLLNLLNIDENKRFNVRNIIECRWFKGYYNKYQKQMEKKSISQKEQLFKQKKIMAQMPFYKLA